MNVLLEKKALLYTYYIRAVYISKHSDGECSITDDCNLSFVFSLQ